MLFFFRKRFGAVLGLITQVLVCAIWIFFAYSSVQELREYYSKPYLDPVPPGVIMLAWELTGAFGSIFWFFRQFSHAEANRRLLAFLEKNAEKLRNNEEVYYRCKAITLKTVLVRHHLVCSAMVVSGRMTTRWLIKGQEPRMKHALGASLYCFWNGWWGLPFGLIWTPIAMARNVAGDSMILVEELIRVPPPPFASIGQRVAHRMKRDLKELLLVN